MMGIHPFQVKVYYQLSLDDLVPKSHLLRRIADVIDFSFVYRLARPFYSHSGQPSIDPVVQDLAHRLSLRHHFRAQTHGGDPGQPGPSLVLGYDLDEPVPNHSVLSKARVRFGMQVFDDFFTKTVDLCRAAGLVHGEATFIDSTLMRANASMSSLETTSQHEPPLEPRQYVERLFAENDPANPPDLELPESPRPRRGKAGRTPSTNQRQRSRTDPDPELISQQAFGQHLRLQNACRRRWRRLDDHLLRRRKERL